MLITIDRFENKKKNRNRQKLLTHTGITAVGHDSESTITIPKCPDAGCYSRPIVYSNSTIRQLKALTEISAECYQSIQVKKGQTLLL